MGTIRNKMLFISHADKLSIQKMRTKAVEYFTEAVSEDGGDCNVDKLMVSPIMKISSDTQYIFAIMGDCSKLGWETSEKFAKYREDYVESILEDDENAMVVELDFGEDYGCQIINHSLNNILCRVMVVHHYNRKTVDLMYADAVKLFNETENKSIISQKAMVSPILHSYINGEYSFVVFDNFRLNDVYAEKTRDYITKWCKGDTAQAYIIVNAEFGDGICKAEEQYSD